MQAVDLFESGIKTEATRKAYSYWLGRFLAISSIEKHETLLQLGKNDPAKLTEIIIEVLGREKERMNEGEISSSTVISLFQPVKLFCVMNDIILNWDKIARILPKNNNVGQDRAIDLKEIRQLLKYADLRMRAIILTMATSGIRVGAIPELKVKHLEPIMEDGKLLAAKLLVYAGDGDNQHITFITPEAYEGIREYLDLRKRHGENIEPNSPLFRNKFKKKAKKVSSVERDAIRVQLHRIMKESGLRQEKRKRYEFKTNHGFRKFFKTRAEQVMKPIHVEMLMGHAIGMSKHYYKPNEREILQDYLNAVPLLTIEQGLTQTNDESTQKQIEELKKDKNETLEIYKLDHELYIREKLLTFKLLEGKITRKQYDDAIYQLFRENHEEKRRYLPELGDYDTYINQVRRALEEWERKTGVQAV